MPMPELDPSRFYAAVLADPSHKLPLPDRGGRLFSADPEGEIVDSADPFYAHLLADGSLKRKPAVPAEVETAADPTGEAKLADPAPAPKVDATAPKPDAPAPGPASPPADAPKSAAPAPKA